jgi:hypothetical protein
MTADGILKCFAIGRFYRSLSILETLQPKHP